MSTGLVIATSIIVRVVWTSLAASVLVSLTFALGIFGLVRSSEMRAERRGAAASGYAALAICALGCFGASVILGILLVTQKG